MKRGEIAEFMITSKYAYGALGYVFGMNSLCLLISFRCPPRIPPDATLEYEVRLVSFLDSGEAVSQTKINSLICIDFRVLFG